MAQCNGYKCSNRAVVRFGSNGTDIGLCEECYNGMTDQ